MENLDKFVPFAQRTRWQMIRHLIHSGITEKTLRSRTGWTQQKIRSIIFSANKTIRIDDLAVWHFSIDGSLVKFSMVMDDG